MITENNLEKEFFALLDLNDKKEIGLAVYFLSHPMESYLYSSASL